MKTIFSVVRSMIVMLATLAFTTALVRAEEPAESASKVSHHDGAFVVNFGDLKWKKIVPELGDDSPEIVFLHVDPKTQATQLMIRCPKAMHVPKHWHTGDETHLLLHGSFVLDCEGVHKKLGPGDFNYMPGKMVHEAWAAPDKDGFLIFITIDRAWDIQWVEGPPDLTDIGKTAPE